MPSLAIAITGRLLLRLGLGRLGVRSRGIVRVFRSLFFPVFLLRAGGTGNRRIEIRVRITARFLILWPLVLSLSHLTLSVMRRSFCKNIFTLFSKK